MVYTLHGGRPIIILLYVVYCMSVCIPWCFHIHFLLTSKLEKSVERGGGRACLEAFFYYQ